MKNDYTSGVWSVTIVRGSYKQPYLIETDSGKVVAHCVGNQLEPDATSIKEARANSALIAAAPDMYRALAAVLSSVKLESGVGELVAAALKKAESRR
jgi:hypothetical protein